MTRAYVPFAQLNISDIVRAIPVELPTTYINGIVVRLPDNQGLAVIAGDGTVTPFSKLVGVVQLQREGRTYGSDR